MGYGNETSPCTNDLSPQSLFCSPSNGALTPDGTMVDRNVLRERACKEKCQRNGKNPAPYMGSLPILLFKMIPHSTDVTGPSPCLKNTELLITFYCGFKNMIHEVLGLQFTSHPSLSFKLYYKR